MFGKCHPPHSDCFVITHLAWSCTGQRNRWPPVHRQPQTWCTGTSHWNGRTRGFPAHSSDRWEARNQRARHGPRCGRTCTPRMALLSTCHRRISRCTVGERLEEGERSRHGDGGTEMVRTGAKSEKLKTEGWKPHLLWCRHTPSQEGISQGSWVRWSTLHQVPLPRSHTRQLVSHLSCSALEKQVCRQTDSWWSDSCL